MAKEQIAKGVDLVWDSWINSLKTIEKVQEDFEKRALQAFNVQKEFIESSVSGLNAIEEEAKKASKEWQERLENSLQNLGKEGQFIEISKWLESVQEITEKAQNLAWKPNNALLDLFANAQKQIEITLQQAIEQQKQERIETISKIEEIASQLKETHKKLLAVAD
ncbi:PhaP protein [Ureibacillus thermophilus]|uniref:PhaP protein n=1 Tax=Ureibacillus thermophilus TaxID=367743 RepID=UPI00360A1D3C